MVEVEGRNGIRIVQYQRPIEPKPTHPASQDQDRINRQQDILFQKSITIIQGISIFDKGTNNYNRYGSTRRRRQRYGSKQ